MLRVVSPVYLAEIATKSKRGMVISTFQTMKYLGRVLGIILIIYFKHHDNAKYAMTEEDMRRQWDRDHNPKTFSHETFAYPYTLSNYSKNFLKFIKIFPSSFFLFLIFFFIPNTPRYLFYTKHYNKAFKILYRLYTPKKLVTISEEDLPESFFQHIYRYRKKMGLLFGNGFKSGSYNYNNKITPISDEEEERLNIYSNSIYSNTNKDLSGVAKNDPKDASTKTLSPTTDYYRILDEEDQIDDLVDTIERNQEASKKIEKEKEKEKEKDK
eukprot:jgi/Orpsp1_1/1184521/evm.model.c7180000089869.1